MTNKKAKKLWEFVLLHGAKSSILEELKITKEEAKVFMSYTMPEIFVGKEINRVNLLKVKELKARENKLFSRLQEKESLNLMITVGIFFYFIIVLPVLVSIAYIKYLF